MANHSDKIEKKIKIFENAVEIEKIKLNPIKIEKIFLAIDAEDKAKKINENAVEIAKNFALTHQAEVYIACIATTTEEIKISEELVGKAIELLKKNKINVNGSCIHGHPSEHILELSNQFNPTLIILPTPYGERIEPFNIESLGTSVDIILRKSPFSTLLVRKPITQPKDIMKSVLLISDSIKNIKTAEWSLALVENKSKMMILSITEKETVEKVEELAESLLEPEINRELVEHIHLEENKALINGIISHAENKDIQIERKHLIGDRIKLALEESEKEHTILILATKIEQDTILENEVENISRLSQIPVLVIKN